LEENVRPILTSADVIKSNMHNNSQLSWEQLVHSICTDEKQPNNQNHQRLAQIGFCTGTDTSISRMAIKSKNMVQ
jgi:hypothetical protein